MPSFLWQSSGSHAAAASSSADSMPVGLAVEFAVRFVVGMAVVVLAVQGGGPRPFVVVVGTPTYQGWFAPLRKTGEPS